jgi:hypothetical protein
MHAGESDDGVRPIQSVRIGPVSASGIPISAGHRQEFTGKRRVVSFGWHYDFNLRRKHGEKFDQYSLTVEPRSAYMLNGESRAEWEHGIPRVDKLWYSITFRNFR